MNERQQSPSPPPKQFSRCAEIFETMAPLLSLQSLLHVSSLENGANHHKKKFKDNSHAGNVGVVRQKQKSGDSSNVNFLIEGKAIKQRKARQMLFM